MSEIESCITSFVDGRVRLRHPLSGENVQWQCPFERLTMDKDIVF